MNFQDLFQTATAAGDGGNGLVPYPYQSRFAMQDELPELLNVPTGVGKTATVALGWLWRRRFAGDHVRGQTPRRLVYCLPMRTLVEQTRDECLKWLDRLGLFAGEVEYADVGKSRVKSYSLKPGDEKDKDWVAVHLLMGGEDDERWDAHPERDFYVKTSASERLSVRKLLRQRLEQLPALPETTADEPHSR